LQIEKGKGIVDAQYQRIPSRSGQYKNMAMRDFLVILQENGWGIEPGFDAQNKSETKDNPNDQHKCYKKCQSKFRWTCKTVTRRSGLYGVSYGRYEQWRKTGTPWLFTICLRDRHGFGLREMHVTDMGIRKVFRVPKIEFSSARACETCHGPGKRHVDDSASVDSAHAVEFLMPAMPYGGVQPPV
jgi:hypothetical protein